MLRKAKQKTHPAKISMKEKTNLSPSIKGFFFFFWQPLSYQSWTPLASTSLFLRRRHSDINLAHQTTIHGGQQPHFNSIGSMVDPRVREENWKGWGWERQRKKRRGGGAIAGEISSNTVGMEERENRRKRVSEGFLGGGWKSEK